MAGRLDERQRVVITGLGAVSALGPDAPSSWRRLVSGESGIRPVTLFPVEGYRTTVAAEVDGFVDPKTPRRAARTDRIAISASLEALRDAGVEPAELDLARVAVVLGAGAAGLFESEGYFEDLLRHGPRRAGVARTTSYFPSATTDWVAAALGISGPRETVVTACSSSAISVGLAYDAVRRGRADVAITGGADTLSRLTFSGFNALRAMDAGPCRPFDRNRSGLTIGEAAGILVLEGLPRARARGARIYAEMLGYGVRCDAFHMTAPDEAGDGALRTMRDALRMARVAPGDVGWVNAHGTATPLNDRSETLAIKRLFGDHARRLWVSSVKAAFGHCLGAAGAIEAVALALSIHQGIVPPTLRLETPDPECDLDYVPGAARELSYGIGISNSFAFGGNNAALVFGRFDG
ncbi:MAG: beta-ketoacyl-[acyl-carrier-protein] synthase family protein [Acidobacteriota bacterium]